MAKVDSWIDHAGNRVTRRSNGTLNVELICERDSGLTEQGHLDECDLSVIVGRYTRAGMPLGLPSQEFSNLVDLPDYQESLNAVHIVDKLFASLPIKVKSAFGQDPAALMRAMNDPTQRDYLIELGVLEAPKEPLKSLASESLKSDASESKSGDKSST